MVPGGSQPAERHLRIAADERAYHRARAASGMQRRRVGRLSDERVLVDLTAAAQRHPTDVPNQHRRVHQLELGERRCRRLYPRAARPASPLERRLDRVNPLRSIGMLGQEHPGVVLAGRAVMEIQHLIHIAPLPHITPLARHTHASTRAGRPPPLQSASHVRSTTHRTASRGGLLIAPMSSLPRAARLSRVRRRSSATQPAAASGLVRPRCPVVARDGATDDRDWLRASRRRRMQSGSGVKRGTRRADLMGERRSDARTDQRRTA